MFNGIDRDDFMRLVEEIKNAFYSRDYQQRETENKLVEILTELTTKVANQDARIDELEETITDMIITGAHENVVDKEETKN